jgi:hypothetical protein
LFVVVSVGARGKNQDVVQRSGKYSSWFMHEVAENAVEKRRRTKPFSADDEKRFFETGFLHNFSVVLSAGHRN